MPRLRVLSADQICRILKEHGFVRVRQTGSHIIMRRQFEARRITIPIPNHSEIAKELLRVLSAKARFQNQSL